MKVLVETILLVIPRFEDLKRYERKNNNNITENNTEKFKCTIFVSFF